MAFNPDEPRDERGRWTTGGSQTKVVSEGTHANRSASVIPKISYEFVKDVGKSAAKEAALVATVEALSFISPVAGGAAWGFVGAKTLYDATLMLRGKG